MNIGKKIKSIRLARKAAGDSDWTQGACAGRVGKSIGWWADLEADRSSPNLSTLEKVCKALDCEVADLVS